MLDYGRTLMIVSTCLVITACGIWGNKHSTDPITPMPTTDHKRNYWFCIANEAGDDWDCVQRPRLATNPSQTKLTKQPQPETAPIATVQPLNPSDTLRPDPLQVATGQTNVDIADAKVRTAVPAPSPKPAPVFEPNRQFSEPPDWRQLAYRPSTSIDLSELPAHFYAVQIVAMSSMEALQLFAKEHLLSDVLAARVEANGEFFYVLLLGTYETLADANAAAASRPDPLMNIQPWVRKLGSLQDAIARGDLLAKTTNY